MLSRNNVPLNIIKGGSAIELFIKNRRATQDLDIHNDKNDIVKLLENLQDKQKLIFFKFQDVNDFFRKYFMSSRKENMKNSNLS